MSNTEKTENVPENERDLIVKNFKKAVSTAIGKLNENDGGEYYYKLDDARVMIKPDSKADLYISIAYATKFMEISWDIAEGLDPEELGISEEEADKLFDEAYQEKLDEINGSYAIRMSSDITIDLSDHYPELGELTIKTTPLVCTRDYCDVGILIELRFENVDLGFIKTKADQLASIIYDAISKVIELALI